MNCNDSGFARLLNLVRHHGLRHGTNTIASSLAKKYFRPPQNVFASYGMVLNEDRPAYLSASQSGPLRINWILPGIGAGHGGFFNVFRTIKQLEVWGHENNIYLLRGVRGGATAAKEQIRTSYFPIKADVAALSENIKDSDALIATSWPTAYAIRKIGNTARKFYFVQDLEYMFYAPGSLYEFARQTYQFGFQGIAAGQWIADVLAREFNMECSVFGFSYDREEYGSTGKRLLSGSRKRVLFYARPETERRGFELGAFALSIVAKKFPEVEFVFVGCSPQLVDFPFRAVFLGVVPISDLGSLYRSCDVALVLSHTNLSLLPLELMACGCAVVSNEGPNVEWLLTDECVQFAKPSPRPLAEAIIELLESDELRRRKSQAGIAFARSTDWTKEVRAIESAIAACRRSPNRLVRNA